MELLLSASLAFIIWHSPFPGSSWVILACFMGFAFVPSEEEEPHPQVAFVIQLLSGFFVANHWTGFLHERAAGWGFLICVLVLCVLSWDKKVKRQR